MNRRLWCPLHPRCVKVHLSRMRPRGSAASLILAPAALTVAATLQPLIELIKADKRRLSQIERDLSQIADLVDTIIAADEELRTKADILVSIPGIA